MHSTTTFGQILHLYQEERSLLDKDELTDAERARLPAIHAELDRRWRERRAELVFRVCGPPRMLSAPDPRSGPQVRRFASAGGD